MSAPRPRRQLRRQERGQAVVELALGSLVLVTILVVGIHFAEFGFMWVKLEEGANFALFDETNRPMHTTPGNWGVFAGDLSGAGSLESRVKSRYEDFNGLTSATGSTTFTQVFTRGSAVSVSCQRYKGPDIDVTGAGTVASDAYGAAEQQNAGVSCQMSAKLSKFRMPNKFFTKPEGGNNDVKMIDSGASPVACAAGRPNSGSCTGSGFRMVLDDWGFQGANESQNCPLTSSGCANTGYYQMAQTTYTAAGGSNGGAGSALAKLVAGASPTTEAPFWMSFQGEDSTAGGPFMETHGAEMDPTWPTTPFDHPSSYQSAFGSNNECFLGSSC